MITIKLTEKEVAVIEKALTYQMVDVAFLDSFKGEKRGAEKRLLEKILVKISTQNNS